MTVSIRPHTVRIHEKGFNYSILCYDNVLVFVMLVGDEDAKRFMHMVAIEL